MSGIEDCHSFVAWGFRRRLHAGSPGWMILAVTQHGMVAREHIHGEGLGLAGERGNTKAAGAVCLGKALVKHMLAVGQQDGDRVRTGLIPSGLKQRCGWNGIALADRRSFAIDLPNALHVPGEASAGVLCMECIPAKNE